MSLRGPGSPTLGGPGSPRLGGREETNREGGGEGKRKTRSTGPEYRPKGGFVREG